MSLQAGKWYMTSPILIDSQPYSVYADVGDADLYLAASSHAANWVSATTLVKQQALITATRILDRQAWKGTKTVSSQDLEWPRTGTGVTGVEDSVVPGDIIDASIEMALALVDGSELQTDSNTAQKLQVIRAGSVSLTYFRGAEGSARRFPTIIHELVRKYLSGSTPAVQGVVSGADGVSVTSDDKGFSRGI